MNRVVIAIIEQDSKILLSKIKQDKLEEFGGLQYVFPGGETEDDVPLTDAVVQKIKAETGLDVEVIGQISFRIHPVTSREVYYYHCACPNYDVQHIPTDPDVESLHWVPIDEIDSFVQEMNPDIKRYLQVL
jgi:ADP-ribose pyrophosphatase YjhB (NUDIX family)